MYHDAQSPSIPATGSAGANYPTFIIHYPPVSLELAVLELITPHSLAFLNYQDLNEIINKEYTERERFRERERDKFVTILIMFVCWFIPYTAPHNGEKTGLN